jgi:hypothetical protein
MKMKTMMIATALGVGTGTVQRIKAEMSAAVQTTVGSQRGPLPGVHRARRHQLATTCNGVVVRAAAQGLRKPPGQAGRRGGKAGGGRALARNRCENASRGA